MVTLAIKINDEVSVIIIVLCIMWSLHEFVCFVETDQVHSNTD